ncbi:TonB-dependent receptor [Acinetobacter sp.]|jgi:protein TonB|uniref:TonB-dependent receptor n=1 Tax=Acinetobacter sp. TaxID=472 RepID=UPI0035B43931
MSQSSAPMMPAPNPMKKKVITALAAVVIGHAGVLWAVGQMKTPELKPVEKKPIQVRFVKLEEAPKPLPPKPKPEPKKEPPKPKEVKIVDKPLPPPPKKVEKVEQVKKAEKPKPAAKPAEAPKTSPIVSSAISETRRPAPEPAPAVKPAEPPAQPAAPPGPKSPSLGGGVSWQQKPQIRFARGELKASCSLVVVIGADVNGKITSTSVKNSNCSPAVERKVAYSIKRSGALTKYVENGVAYPLVNVEAPFDFQLK